MRTLMTLIVCMDYCFLFFLYHPKDKAPKANSGQQKTSAQPINAVLLISPVGGIKKEVTNKPITINNVEKNAIK